MAGGACISLECLICGRALVRNGKTAAGKQRYRCLDCGASCSGERPDVSRRPEMEACLGWLVGTGSQEGVASFGTARSFRRRTAWCWNIAPRIPVAGEVHDQIQVDGIYVGSWCCLIAVSGGLRARMAVVRHREESRVGCLARPVPRPDRGHHRRRFRDCSRPVRVLE